MMNDYIWTFVENGIHCPRCMNDLGEPTEVDLNSVGYHCSKCKIQVYEER